MNNDNNFFDWFVGLFKKKKKEIEPLSDDEFKMQLEWQEKKVKYRLEYLDSMKLYFVQYYYNEQWWYLRKWDGDYFFERVRGNAIRINKPEELDQIIFFHQDWIKQGHIVLNYD